MATDLTVYGPFDVPLSPESRSKFIDSQQKKDFLQIITDEGLSDKHGCYIFALRVGRGYSPWYIGKSTKGMKRECMGSHQLQHYNAVLSNGYRGTPVMFFVLQPDDREKVKQSICDEVESVLIQSAFFKNPDLRNIQKANHPEWSIYGVLRSKRGRQSKNAVAFKTMMGL